MKEVATAKKLNVSTIGPARGEEASKAASGLELLPPLLPMTQASHKRNIEREIAIPPKMEAFICERAGIVISLIRGLTCHHFLHVPLTLKRLFFR